MITMNNFHFKYAGSDCFALQNINLTIKEGEFVGVIGNSGAGKSTLTYAINGVIPHHYHGDFYGDVSVDGMSTVEVTPEQLSACVGSVFQDIDGQMVASVVEDELLFGLENFGFVREEITQRIDDALATMGIADLRYRSICTLSGGQKQKVALAAILALKPRILVLDEPTGELDPQSSGQIFTMLRELNQTYGITVVVVEQKIMLLCEYVKRLIVMGEGSILLDGEVHEVLEHSKEMEAVGIHIPRVATLANLLIDKGLYLGRLPRNLDEAEAMVREVMA